ncbi:unnamed protein product [Caenorhabditis angaria]|uniref:Uncharacterized protein n=1 Tax=Caenorhabditis angaria TaxID=860376 RepID=A0A9P1MX35_9PELO|nr:unnamed protein product [Caenorhabditis angaria]
MIMRRGWPGIRRFLWSNVANEFSTISCFPWIDDDVDSSALLFNFQQQNKDAAILSTVSPYLPLTTFTQHDIEERKVMLRHLGHHSQFEISYSVTDGVHTVPAKMNVIAAQPDVWIEHAEIVTLCSSASQEILVNAQSLSVATNLDVRLEDIVYFCDSATLDRKKVATFTQADVMRNRVRIVVAQDSVGLRVKVADRNLDIDLKITCDEESTNSNSQKPVKNRVLRVPMGGAVLFQFENLTTDAAAIFEVLKHPEFGYLSLDHDEKSYSAKVASFSGADIAAGNVQFVHSSATTANDSMEFRVGSGLAANEGYYYMLKVDVEVFERNITIQTATFSVPSSGRAPILPTSLNITTSEPADESPLITIISPPTSGWITTDATTGSTSVSQFTASQIKDGRIWFVSDGTQGNDSVGLRACKPPIITRNEVLRIGATGRALITNSHLDVEDQDTPPNSILYIIAQPSAGRVVRANQPEQTLHNFTQFDIDQSNVEFIVEVNSSSFIGRGGFSFHLSDGQHRIGPEWFSIEMTATSTSVETNGRLIASPASATIIGTELLRANMPGTRPEDIHFTVTRTPKFGELLIDGIKGTHFTQTQINRRQVVYSTLGFPEQNEWSRRDSFGFKIASKTGSKPVKDSGIIQKYITTRPLLVSRGGSACFNQSHLDVLALVEAVGKEVIMIEIGTEPRSGRLEWLDNEKKRVSWTELRSAFYLIYHHEASDALMDSLVFHIYAARESTRRTSRIRIDVDILVTNPPDAKVEVVNFPKDPVSVLNSGSTNLLPDLFMTRHRTVPPQSIIYRTIQRGSNGVTLRKNEEEIGSFNQQDINDGKISIWHTAPRNFQGESGWHDVIVFDIEGHMRTLVVEIKPIDLILKNHSVIEYPQGKTYVVLKSQHLGAFSNGNNRSALKYRVTHGPENGTFYWVAGEKEAKEFTQKDIDEERILYAQLNMHSYQDRFEFQIENETRDVVRNSSILRVKALVAVQPVIVEAETATPLTTSQINASTLLPSSPRFFLTSPLKYGRLTFDQNTNYSTYYFTYSDIQKGIVYYKADSADEEVREIVELEIRADDVQPARFSLPITILRAEFLDEGNVVEAGEILENEETKSGTSSRFSGNGLPIVILAAILAATIFILVCRRCGGGSSSTSPKHNTSAKLSTHLDTPTRLPPSPTDSLEHPSISAAKPPDLLGSTVFASVKQAEDRQVLQSFTIRPQGIAARTQAVPPKEAVVPRGSGALLDYAGDTPPPMRLFDQVAQTQPTNHYWV